MAIAQQPTTFEEFLKLPEEKPALEFWRGRIVQKVSPQGQHGWLEAKLTERFNRFGEPDAPLMAFAELRATFGEAGMVPDVSVFRRDRVTFTAEGDVANQQPPPDIAIEIVSPGQSDGELIEKCLHYVEHGSAIALLIAPKSRLILRFARGGVVRSLRGQDLIDLSPVVAGLELRVADVFGLLRRPGAEPSA